MPLDTNAVRQCLQDFDFGALFTQELGWDRHASTLSVTVGEHDFALSAAAHKRGMVVFTCAPLPDGTIPDYATRRKIERQVTKSVREHLIIYTDGASTTQVWQWVRREIGKPAACREHQYHRSQPGDSLIQKLQAIAFSLEEEEGLTLVDVTSPVRAAFDIDRVTKRFYDRFKAEHAKFLKFIQGIPDEGLQRWYASVMLNRLMFIYFIQKKGFLDGDPDYLRHKLAESQARGKDQYYTAFLCPLFFEGFACQAEDRSPETRALVGHVPYLNGGIFMRHQVEQLHGQAIQIPDAAFERLFEFFDAYRWHLDERPLRADDEINPDVLGYIFEKYINQRELGAYYTKEDITGYISQNTIIPRLFDMAMAKCRVAFEGDHAVWTLLQADPDRYIYEAVRKGADHELPPEIAAGVDDVAKRGQWNTPAPSEYALPTETWREVVARRQRYGEVRSTLLAGEVRCINDLITLNLDIRQFAQDVIESCEGPDLLNAFWQVIESVTILDPAVGSGAFLFAALNILEPLYEACLDRMEAFLAEWGEAGRRRHPNYARLFSAVLCRIEQHPNRKYFVFKSIVVNNLYGVDIMEEAVEICKLRLFLKLAAQVDLDDTKPNLGIEPLPDIDFNIRAGNTLVGYVSLAQVKATLQGTLGFGLDAVAAIEERAEIADRAFRKFHEMQTEHGMDARGFTEAKADLAQRLGRLNQELNPFLAGEYGISRETATTEAAYQARYAEWLSSHKPFHWFIEFYGIMKSGGFDAIIGNPPYVEYRLVKREYRLQEGRYESEAAGNLYAFFMERSGHLLSTCGWYGMIVPAGVLGVDKAASLRRWLLSHFPRSFCSTFAIRPSKLFDGVDQRLCVYVGSGDSTTAPAISTTRYHHWHSEERAALFPLIRYGRSFNHDRLGRVPQLGSELGMSCLAKLESRSSKTISHYLVARGSGQLLHYHRSPRYWIRGMDFEPYFKSPTRTRSVYHFRDLYIVDADHARAIAAVLNSSLFFFWFQSVGNGRNITEPDICQFPVGSFSRDTISKLSRLFGQLMEDYKAHSTIRTRRDCEFQEFSPSESKPIMDDIDLALGRHFGLTDQQVDFIINYEIKYRMGLDALED